MLILHSQPEVDNSVLGRGGAELKRTIRSRSAEDDSVRVQEVGIPKGETNEVNRRSFSGDDSRSSTNMFNGLES
jgi:hypothetical protein